MEKIKSNGVYMYNNIIQIVDFNRPYLNPELVEKRGEVDELKKVAEDHLAGKMAPCLKRLASELHISLAPHALRELEGRHAETNQSIFNELTRLKLLAIQTKDTVNGVFGVLLSYHMIENVSLRGEERLGGERERVLVNKYRLL